MNLILNESGDNMVRRPAVAGQFYPAGKNELKDKIEECFDHELGPGGLPGDEGVKRSLKGLVAPHAGYVYSGPVAAHSYKKLYEDGLPETFLILGPNHHGMGGSVAISDENFKTPLGEVEIDKELVDELAGGPIKINDSAHKSEHSVEVQLPFLQYLDDDITMVPFTFNKHDYQTSKEVGERIRKATEEKDVVIIASTDFSHYVLQETAEEKDKMAINKIKENDPKGLYEKVINENISMCGYGPVISMMIGSGGEKGELLKYATSGDIMSMREVVGYGALSFE